MSRPKRRIWIDTDCGGDDAIGIMCALTQPDVVVDGISCVWGNVNVDQAMQNVAKLLDLFGRDIPIYRGADRPLLGTRETVQWGGFGSDGFGDAEFPDSMKAAQASKTHASLAIVEWAKQINPIETGCVYQLITLGPLSNVALALRLYPDLYCNLGAVGVPGMVVMGGTIEAKGNSNLTSEFNIHCDPEAAHICFLHQGLSQPFYLVSWELTVNCAMSWNFYDKWVNRQALAGGEKKSMNQNRIQYFIEKMFQRLEAFTRPQEDGTKADTGDAEATQDVTCVIPDAVAMVVALCDGIINDSIDTFVTVELQGKESRGMTCIDWYGTEASLAKRGRWRNCKAITKCDIEVFLQAMRDITAFQIEGN